MRTTKEKFMTPKDVKRFEKMSEEEPKFFPLEEKVQMIFEESQAIVRRLNAMHDRLNGAGQCGDKPEQAYPPIGVAASATLQQMKDAHELISTIELHLFSSAPRSGREQ